jgi:hypothetical protein
MDSLCRAFAVPNFWPRVPGPGVTPQERREIVKAEIERLIHAGEVDPSLAGLVMDRLLKEAGLQPQPIILRPIERSGI